MVPSLTETIAESKNADESCRGFRQARPDVSLDDGMHQSKDQIDIRVARPCRLVHYACGGTVQGPSRWELRE